MAFAIPVMLLWAWMWDNADKLKLRVAGWLLWLVHMWLAAAWVTNFLVGMGIK